MIILIIADLHIGSIKDISYIYNTTTNIIEKEVIFKKTDVVIFLGDYFDKLFKVNEGCVSLAINIMSYLIRACKRSNTKIRMIYGTESHEMNQYKLFNYHITSTNIDMKIIDTVTEEKIGDKNILYIPEEYIDNKYKYYKDYLYSDKHYDYIFGHGIIEDGMQSVILTDSASKSNEKQVPRFKSGELSNVSNITVFGHYHSHVDMHNNVYYLGSLFRDSFGEEEPKGYGIIEDDKFEFIENKEAYIFKTYEFAPNSEIYNGSDNIIKEINKIKKENKEIFTGEKQGKIRLVFKTPESIDPTFRENLMSILFNDKYITPLIKDTTSPELINEIEDDDSDEYDFILDNSLPIIDKIHQYIIKEFDDPMTLETLKKYLKKSLK